MIVTFFGENCVLATAVSTTNLLPIGERSILSTATPTDYPIEWSRSARRNSANVNTIKQQCCGQQCKQQYRW